MPGHNDIVNFSPEAYGDRYQEHIMQQYIMYVESAHKNSSHRHTMNRFCLALNTAFFGLLGVMFNMTNHSVELFWFVPVAMSGVVLCYVWYRLVISYKSLNSAKFDIINEVEKRIPLALFSEEQKILNNMEGKNQYKPFSQIEKHVPLVFAVLYVVMILFVSFKIVPFEP